MTEKVDSKKFAVKPELNFKHLLAKRVIKEIKTKGSKRITLNSTNNF